MFALLLKLGFIITNASQSFFSQASFAYLAGHSNIVVLSCPTFHSFGTAEAMAKGNVKFVGCGLM